MLADETRFQTILGLSLAIWIVWTTLASMYERLRHQKYKWFAVHTLPSAFIGMCFAHIGFAVTIVGVCLTSHYSIEPVSYTHLTLPTTSRV